MSNSKKITPFSLRTTENGIKYKSITKRLRDNYSLDQIRDMWNAAELGAPLKSVTVKRWLNKGPDEKNQYFEGFVMGMESAFRTSADRRIFYVEVPDGSTPEQITTILAKAKTKGTSKK